MRGDSLRDLYAKTLALLGLGVLAGAGALVDYWPVGFRLPQVASALQPPAAASALQAVPDARPAVSLETRASVRPSPPRQPALEPEIVLASLPTSHGADVPLGVTVQLAEPMASLEPAVFTLAERRPELPAVVSDETTFADEDAFVFAGAQSAALSAEDETGFLRDAFRKTGHSIVKTGVRTGASIVDAVRVVGVAVRRALPN